MEILSEIHQSVVSSSTDSVVQILAFWPQILAAFTVFIIGWLLSILLRKGIIKLGDRIKIPHFAEKSGFKDFLEKANIQSPPSVVIAKFFQAWIITIFLLAATKIVHLDTVSNFLEAIIYFIPNLIVAILILLFAVRFGDFASGIVAGALSLADSHATKVVSIVVKNILIAFGIMAAIVQLDIPGASELIRILFIGFVASISLAGGLAFGLGGKDFIRDLLENLKKTK